MSELDDIEAELSRRGGPSDELGQIEAELQRRMQPARESVQFATTPSGAAMYSPKQMRRTVGLEHTGDTAANLADAVLHAGYNVGGRATDLASSAGASPEVAAGVGAASNLGTELATTFGAGGVGLLKAPFQAAGKTFMKWGLNPSVAEIKSGGAKKAIDTLLQGGYTLRPGEMERLSGAVDALNSQISHVVATSPSSINRRAEEFSMGLKQLIVKMRAHPTEWNEDLKLLMSKWKDFSTHPFWKGGAEMLVQDAQALKQEVHKRLGEAYGKYGKPGVEIQKGIGRSLKEAIESKHPELAALNAKEGELLNALELATKPAQVTPGVHVGLASHRGGVSPFAYLSSHWPWLQSEVGQGLYHQGARAAATLPAASTGLPPRRLEEEYP